MKIRIYSPFIPYPVTEGAFQVIQDQAKSLLEQGHEVELVSWKDSEAEFTRRSSLLRNSNPAFSSMRFTRFGSRQPDRRAIRILKSIASADASPELYYYPPEADQRRSLAPADLGIYHYSFSAAWLRRARGPEARRAVHFHNLESELAQARSKEETLAVRWLHLRNFRKLARHERLLLNWAEELWFVSRKDLATFPGGRFVPPTFDPALIRNRRGIRQAFKSVSKPVLGIIGAMDFIPNQLSVRWLLDSVAPLLAERRFDGLLRIVGRSAPEDLLERGRPYPFVRFDGFLPNVEEFWSGISALLVPDLGGAGVRIKLLEALASGVPVICNRAALAAVDPELHGSPLVMTAESPEEWISRIYGLTPELWSKAVNLRSPGAILGAGIYSFLKDSGL